MGDGEEPASCIYEIRIEGELDGRWSEWLNGLTITCQGQRGEGYEGDVDMVTTLRGPVADQAALRGVLCRLWDLSLTLISVRRLEADGRRNTRND